MEHIKTYSIFEGNSHWTDEIMSNIKPKRSLDLKELLYDFIDVGKVDIINVLLRNDFSTNIGGKKQII